MEKASSNNNSTNLSHILQKALSIGHAAAPFSPAREFRHHRTSSTANRGLFFSSPLVPTTARARRRTKTDVVLVEPTSPKVSCIGQIKLAKPNCPEKKNKASKNLKTATYLSSRVTKEEDKGNFSKLKRLFSTKRNPLRRSKSIAVNQHPVAAAVEAVTLGNMKKFSSSREALRGFDWTVQMKREESQLDHRRVSSFDDEDKMIPSSVSMPLSQLLSPIPKNEVNLWKRRTMDRPKPFQVKSTH